MDPTKPTGTRVIRGKTSQWWTSLIHLIPVALAYTLLWLNYTRRFWFPETGLHNRYVSAQANSILNWLQLGAKLFEIVVIASLASITLSSCQRALVTTGLPLGMLSSAYRVGDVFYLAHLKFWRAQLFATRKSATVIGLALLLIASTLLSILVGPASAILIIPELGWFPLSGAFSNTAMPLFFANTTHVWPNSLENWTIPEYCGLERGAIMYDCPAGGLADFYTWAEGWELSGLPDNITFQDPSGTLSRVLEMRHHPDEGTFATTPTALTAKTLGQLNHFVSSKDLGTISEAKRWRLQYQSSVTNFQPLVQTKCNIHSIRENLLPDSYTFELDKDLDCFTDDTDNDCYRIKESLEDLPINLGPAKDLIKDVSYHITTTDTLYNTTNSSVVLLASFPFAENDQRAGVHLLACTYMAHWIPSRPGIDPFNTDHITTNITDLNQFFVDTSTSDTKKRPYVGETINLDSSWLRFFDLSMNDDDQATSEDADSGGWVLKVADNNEYTIGSLLATMTFVNSSGFNETNDYFGVGTDFDKKTNKTEVKRVVEKLTGSLLADAIARTAADTPAFLITSEPSKDNDYVTIDQVFSQRGPYSDDWTLLKNGSFYDGRNYTTLLLPDLEWGSLEDLTKAISKSLWGVDFDVQQYGYGFGQPGDSANFAVVVIFTYLCILLLYWVTVLVCRAKTVNLAEDVDDLLVLAWTSPTPPDLKGQGAQVKDQSVWSSSVSVRARDDNHVSLLLEDGNEESMQMLEKDREYH